MKRIVLNIFVITLKIIYAPIKLFKVQNKVVYISRQSNRETLDFRLIKNEMGKMYPNYKNVILTKKIESGLISKIGYVFHMFKQMYHISTSKIVILDSYCIVASVLKHKKENKIIQIWHALSAIKKFGYQSIGTEAGSDALTAKIMCMHKNYNYVLAPSEITAQYFKEAFDVKEEQIKYLGMPRMDYILKNDNKINEKIFHKYPILKEKTNILYVPTFRNKEIIPIQDLVNKINTNKYNLIVKLHPLDTITPKIERDGIIYDNEFSGYDLLKITDKVITDYSSLAMEISLLNIPIYFYTYDIEEYKRNPGLNFDFDKEEIGRYQATKVNKLLQILEQDYDYKILEHFKNKYISIDKQDCTKKIVNFMMGECNE